MAKSNLTAKRLRELLHYDPETGIFRWSKNRRNVVAGTVAGSPTSDGYRQICVDMNRYRAHRLAWLYVYDEWPGGCIDHINQIKTDNRISNIRVASVSQNSFNTTIRSLNTSGFKGVSFHKIRNKWQARSTINGKAKSLGLFDTAIQASEAYENYAKKHHGEFFCSNK